jgi:hypothetical protein
MASATKTEHDWARLSCLVYELKWRRMSGVVAPLDVGLLQSYERDLESVEDKRNAMETEVARYRADPLHRTIRSGLYKLYILLGCAVRFNKQPHDDIDLALRPFGFVLNPSQRPTDNKDLMLVGMTVYGRLHPRSRICRGWHGPNASVAGHGVLSPIVVSAVPRCDHLTNRLRRFHLGRRPPSLAPHQ